MNKTFKQWLFGTSDFFYLKTEKLIKYREFMVENLTNLSFTEKEINLFCNAYDWFCENPDRYDGSTFVRDLYDIRLNKKDRFGKKIKLAFASMVHDYVSIMGANKSIVKFFKSNVQYFNHLRKLGKGIHIGRFIGLTLLTIPFVISIKLKLI